MTARLPHAAPRLRQEGVLAQLHHNVTFGAPDGCARAAARPPARARLKFAPLERSSENQPSLLAAPVTALPVPTLTLPAPPPLDGACEALRAEVAELAARVTALREAVPAALRARAAAQQVALRDDARRRASAAAAPSGPAQALVPLAPAEGSLLAAAAADGNADGADGALETALASAVAGLPGARARMEGASGRLERILGALEAHAAGGGAGPVADAVAAVVAGTACEGLRDGEEGGAEAAAGGQAEPARPMRELAATLAKARYAPY